jgi:integrase
MVKQLTALFVNSVKEQGKYFDGRGHGLFLLVDASGYKRWVQRLRVHGRQRDFGLGSPPLVTLAEARDVALENKKIVMKGGDPSKTRAKSNARMTFAEAAAAFHSKKNVEFKSEKYREQWLSALERYAFPSLSRAYVDEISMQDVVKVIEPIWLTRTVTAKKLQQRIEAILTWATVSGYRTGDNPARWKGNLSEILPKPSKVHKAEHHPALRLSDASRWWAELCGRDGISAMALQFATLCASRSGEVRGMTWSEITFGEQPMWILPAHRAKTNNDHRVPLTPKMVEILKSNYPHPASDLVFHNGRGQPLSGMTLNATMKRMHAADLKNGGPGYTDEVSAKPAVPHGLRSTFRNWAAEAGYDRDIAELQLAHAVGHEVVRAYFRTDMIERRRQMLISWENFLSDNRAGDVINLRGSS